MKVMTIDDHAGIFVEYSDCTYKRKQNKKHHTVFLISIVALSACVGYCSHEFMLLTNLVLHGNSSQYVTQYLKGDTVGTWNPWHLAQNEALTINIINSDVVSNEKLDAIKDAILSKESVEVEDYLLHKAPKGSSSIYYVGWQGAIDAISADTEFPIPRNFVILESPRREGEITIYLSTDVDSDGYTGYTKSTVDEGYTLKSSIIIYNVDELSADQLGTITRHEFGHALGLGHSSAPEDLMAPKIVTPYPYISSCNIDAISALYNGKTASEVTCSK